MIRIVATSTVTPETKEQFVKVAKELVEKSRQEAGCISYGLFEDLKNPMELAILEEWKDQAAIDFHNATEHFTTLVPEMSKYRVGSCVTLYKEI